MLAGLRIWILLGLVGCSLFEGLAGVQLRRRLRNTPESGQMKDLVAPILAGNIDLETIRGIEQVTKLVLIKTDSLPGESDEEKIDARYLNGLMETLYTGLRKPFKSVSADILGIFPSFEEKQVRCELNDNVELVNQRIRIKRGSTLTTSSSHGPYREPSDYETGMIDEQQQLGPMLRGESGGGHKSSLQVCKAVTSDCLSLEDLVQVLPPSIGSFEKAVVRICPIMLFRIMNNICHRKSPDSNGDPSSPQANLANDKLPVGNSTSYNQQSATNQTAAPSSSISLGPGQKFNASNLNIVTGNNNNANASLFLNNLLREKQILASDLSSKKPQKLHKKSRTQTSYKGRWVTPMQQSGNVDEQLQKVRLILTEPSIEKVWIFSLMFVMISIVVSMGGLIVLPFVRKTTRRRILTLFEGLAVGGLAGSATLHMFPQAFGLVNEHYEKYFWRIFMVFAGIYVCYLCERVLKIIKVMRSKLRRSRCSLAQETCQDFRYGFSNGQRMSQRGFSDEVNFGLASGQSYSQGSKSSRKRSPRKSGIVTRLDLVDSETTDLDHGRRHHSRAPRIVYLNNSKSQLAVPRNKLRKSKSKSSVYLDTLDENSSQKDTASPESFDANESHVVREKLVRCLQSVQDQFSRVYAVQTVDENCQQVKLDDSGRLSQNGKRKGFIGRIFLTRMFNKSKQEKRKSNVKRTNKRRDHDILIDQTHRNSSLTPIRRNQDRARSYRDAPSDVGRGYIQHRLSRVNNLAAERQDQDNAARMSVDTVAWMIVFGDAVLNVIDGLSIGAAFERNILAGISISVAVMLEEVTHRLGTFAVLIRAGMSMKQSLLWTFLSACALFPGLVAGIMLSDATEDATPYIFCAAGGIFLYMALVDVMKEMNRSIENAMRKDIKSTLQIFALQNLGIMLAVIFLSLLALYEQAMDFEEYQQKYKHLERNS